MTEDRIHKTCGYYTVLPVDTTAFRKTWSELNDYNSLKVS